MLRLSCQPARASVRFRLAAWAAVVAIAAAVPAAAAPMPPSARFWVGLYRCTSGTPSLISTYTTRIRFTACATGTDIDFYKIQGGTHGWPGGPDAPGNLPPMNEIRASFLIWQFFARHTHK